MFRIAICDDNKYDIKTISSALDILREDGVELETAAYTDGFSLIKDFEKGTRYHLLILDMVMDSINGIETAKRIREHDVSMPILIVTSTREFALEGYLVNAWRYITKPLDTERFLDEVRTVLNNVSERDETYFVIDSSKGLTKLKLDDILYFDSNLHTITAHTLKEQYPFRGKLSQIEEDYADRDFFRIHKSYLVNLQHIKKISKLYVTLINDEVIDVSKLRAAALNDALLTYASKNSRRPKK